LLPGKPFIFDVSCSWAVEFCWFAPAAEPTVSPGLAAGPLLAPGWPAIPAPEFGGLGAVETPGFVVCASAAGADIASARMAMLNILFMTSPPKFSSGKPYPSAGKPKNVHASRTFLRMLK
jgi:hypothetical protein